MLELPRDFLEQFLDRGLVAVLFSIAGFVFAVFLIARLMSEKRAPANTFAWLLIIVLLPYVGVPLYLLLGGRKLRRLAERKSRLRPTLPAGAPTPTTDAEAVAQTVMASGAAAPVAGNRLTLLTTGEAAYAALERGIRGARHSIHVTTFILGRDDTGRRLVRLLAERARAGVKVRLLLDAVGCMFLSRRFVLPIKKAGGEVVWFMPVLPFTSRGSANLRNHRKIAVFDHCTAIIGGQNLAREYMGPVPYRRRFNDFGTLIEGPAAALLNEVFIADWSFASRQSADGLHAEISPDAVVRPRGEADLQIVASGPDVPGDPLYEGILAMIQDAKRSLWIVTPYFLPDEVLLRSLMVKAHAGCAVNLILPARSNHPVTDFARRHYVRELQRAGGRIWLFQPGMLHSKAMIVDDRVALFGSANFDMRSLFVNFEIGVFVHSSADVLAIKGWASSLVSQSKPHRPDKRRKRTFVGNVLEDLSRLLAPLL
ncbi:phospholipase D-like domain-containing protein [Opitutus terrae]|uniref:Phospholipase D/Transphosphatidylase n=1 Tax=Opitutus terrae (strain DSM 11246 / JCM 15787 / PB90-1) TaxID=452637 RepID=B1ZX95_OPITP|nr:phospholipase D-like domain-containing protein [Opitutus terrae]ACB76147.1 phospholipase D/Transphosphatidylase [Opitutus terrae PB90-1]